MTDKKTIVKKRTSTRRLEWVKIDALWMSGTETLESLSKKFGISVSTLRRHFEANGVKKGANKAKVEAKVAEELLKNVAADAALIAARIRETKEEHYKTASNIAKLIWNEVVTARSENRPMATATNNLKALNIAADGLAKVRQERWAILGLDRPDAADPDQLPSLEVSVLSDTEIEQMRYRDEEDDFLTAKAVQSDPQERHSSIDDEDDDEPDGVVSEGD